MAFKEWAVVCEALGSGRQSVTLRKGGIHEGREGFRVEHGEFWLFPTRFHQRPEEIVEEAHPLLERVGQNRPPEGTVRIGLYAAVEEVTFIEDESLLPRLAGLHVWSERTLEQRFHYKRPGLFALAVRMYRLPEPLDIPDSPHFAGCRSWVDLPEPLSTDALEPVLSDEAAERELNRVQRTLVSNQPT